MSTDSTRDASANEPRDQAIVRDNPGCGYRAVTAPCISLVFANNRAVNHEGYSSTIESFDETANVRYLESYMLKRSCILEVEHTIRSYQREDRVHSHPFFRVTEVDGPFPATAR
jgi:hypothetical protein